MNVVSVPEESALSAGAELWIIKNDPATTWWPKLDFASRYLFSQNFFRPQKEIPSELLNIIAATSLDIPTSLKLQNYVLLGTQDHFLNKWTLVWNNLSDAQLAEIVVDLSTKLKFDSVRIFSNSSNLIKQLKTRPTASSLSISFIENT